MEIVRPIIEMLVTYTYIVPIVAGILGEEAVLFLTFLQSIGGVRLELIMILSPLGLFLVDIIYYAMGKFKVLKSIFDKIKNLEERKGVLPRIIRFSNKRPLFAMIITKFIYGTRSSLIAYLSSQKMSFWRFLLYNFIAIQIWAFITIPIAWLIGKWWGIEGLDLLENFFLVVALAFGLIIVIDVLIRLLYYYIRKRRLANLG